MSRRFFPIFLFVVLLSLIPFILLFFSRLKQRRIDNEVVIKESTNLVSTITTKNPHTDFPSLKFVCDREPFTIPTMHELKKKLADWGVACFDEPLEECVLPVADKYESWIPMKYKEYSKRHKMAVIIPIRNQTHINRCEQLQYVVPYLMNYLKDRNYHIFIVELDRGGYYNKAFTMNIASILVDSYDFDYFVFNDVDMIPWSTNNAYTYATIPVHRARYCEEEKWWDGLFGGITQIPRDIFFEANGFSIGYWTWGGEDDDFRERIVHTMKQRGEKDVQFIRLGKDELEVRCFSHSKKHRRGVEEKEVRGKWEKNVIMKEIAHDDPGNSIKGCGVSETLFTVVDSIHSSKISQFVVKMELSEEKSRKLCSRFLGGELFEEKLKKKGIFDYVE